MYFSHKKKGKGKKTKTDMSVYLVYVLVTDIHLLPKCLLETYIFPNFGIVRHINILTNACILFQMFIVNAMVNDFHKIDHL